MIQRDMESFSGGTSQLCRSFVRDLLTPNQSFRPSINDVAQHDWLKKQQKSDHSGDLSKFQENKSNYCDGGRRASLPPEVHLSVIKQMKKKFGFNYSDILSCIQMNKPGSVLATYHLLLNQNKVLQTQTQSAITDNDVKKTSQSNSKESIDDSPNKNLKIDANFTLKNSNDEAVTEKLPVDERSMSSQNKSTLMNSSQNVLENNKISMEIIAGKQPLDRIQELHKTDQDKNDSHKPESEEPKAISDEVSPTNNNTEKTLLSRKTTQTNFRLRAYRPLAAHFKTPSSLSVSPTPLKFKQNQEQQNSPSKSENKACSKHGGSSLLKNSLPKLKSQEIEKDSKTSTEILNKSRETLLPELTIKSKEESHHPTRPKSWLNRKSESKKFKPLPPLNEANLFSKRWRKMYSDKESPTTFASKYSQYMKLCTKHPLPSITKPKKSISDPIAAAISRFTTSKYVGASGERRQN